MTLLLALAALWGAGVWILVRDLDREQAERRKAENKIRPLSPGEESVRDSYRQRDRDRLDAWKATRYADQQAWEINFQTAKHEAHVQELREKARRERWFEKREVA